MNNSLLQKILINFLLLCNIPVHAQDEHLAFLGKGTEETMLNINYIGIFSNEYCIAGEQYHMDLMSGHALVFYVNSKGKVFRYDFKTPSTFITGSATHCVIDGGTMYVLKKMSTHTSPVQNKDRLYVSKMKLKGNQIIEQMEQSLSLDYSSWAYGLKLKKKRVLIHGVMSLSDERYMNFDATLRSDNLSILNIDKKSISVEEMLACWSNWLKRVEENIQEYIKKKGSYFYLAI